MSGDAYTPKVPQSEAGICPRCKKPAAVSVGRYLTTGIEKRLLLCDHCRFFEFSEVK